MMMRLLWEYFSSRLESIVVCGGVKRSIEVQAGGGVVVVVVAVNGWRPWECYGSVVLMLCAARDGIMVSDVIMKWL